MRWVGSIRHGFLSCILFFHNFFLTILNVPSFDASLFELFLRSLKADFFFLFLLDHGEFYLIVLIFFFILKDVNVKIWYKNLTPKKTTPFLYLEQDYKLMCLFLPDYALLWVSVFLNYSDVSLPLSSIYSFWRLAVT